MLFATSNVGVASHSPMVAIGFFDAAPGNALDHLYM
jgi:hypothetical protein